MITALTQFKNYKNLEPFVSSTVAMSLKSYHNSRLNLKFYMYSINKLISKFSYLNLFY